MDHGQQNLRKPTRQRAYKKRTYTLPWQLWISNLKQIWYNYKQCKEYLSIVVFSPIYCWKTLVNYFSLVKGGLAVFCLTGNLRQAFYPLAFFVRGHSGLYLQKKLTSGFDSSWSTKSTPFEQCLDPTSYKFGHRTCSIDCNSIECHKI